jgi:hypothetical protein
MFIQVLTVGSAFPAFAADGDPCRPGLLTARAVRLSQCRRRAAVFDQHAVWGAESGNPVLRQHVLGEFTTARMEGRPGRAQEPAVHTMNSTVGTVRTFCQDE